MARLDWKRIVFLGGLGIVIVAGLVRLFSSDTGVMPQAMTIETEEVLNILPHDAQMALMVNVEDMYAHHQNVPFTPSRADLERMTEEFSALGFDPTRDLKAVYMGSNNLRSNKAVVVAIGKYDQDQLESFIDDELGNRLDVSTYNGATVYTPVNHNGRSEMAFALVNGNMVIGASGEGELQKALDRWAGDAPGLSANAESMSFISQVAHAESGWAMMRDLGHELRPEGRGDMERFARRLGRALRDAVVGFIMDDEGIETNMVLAPRSSVSADDLASVAKGVVAGMKTMVHNDAQLRILDDVNVKASGDNVKVHFFVDYETMDALR